MEKDPKMVSSFEGLAELALSQLRILEQCSIVCGPISTGGLGSVEKNIEIIKVVSDYLESTGIRIFNNIFYEKYIVKLKNEWESEGNTGYCTPILENFYLALYKSGHIKIAYFLPGWESSYGASWERNILPKCGVKIIDLEQSKIQLLFT